MGEDADLRTDPLLEKAPVREGYKVLGGVVLYQKLGQGGMGAVYRGKHLRLEVDVALKVMATPAGIHPDQAANYRQRFLREAKTAASVRHSNLIRVYDVNSEGGVHFLIMDYIDGESAGDRLKRKGKLDEQEAVEIALGAAEGLAAAHRTGIVHRDVKPDNILIDKQGSVVIADLGLAKAYGAGESDSAMSMGLSLTQQAMGTPYYMAPEQTMSAKDVGPAADVWSLGVTLYQLATDSLPWSDSDLVNLMVRIRAEAAPDARQACPGLSEGLCAIIDRALRKDPAERYTDCGEMVKALRRHLVSIAADAGESVLADEAAGTTKLALVSVTPPPSRTLTLIGASLLDAGGSRGGHKEVGTRRYPAAGASEPRLSESGVEAHSRRVPTSRSGKGLALVTLLVLLAVGGGGAAYYKFVWVPQEEARQAEQERLRAEEEARRKAEQVDSLLSAARTFREAGLLDKAHEKIVEALVVIPDHAEAKRLLADIQKEIAAKRAAAERAAEHKKWMERGYQLKLAGKLEEAAEAYARAAEHAPQGSREAADAAASCLHDHLKARAMQAELRGDLERAVDLYGKAQELGDDAETRRLLVAARTKHEKERELEAKRARRELEAKQKEEAHRSARVKRLEADLAELRKQCDAVRARRDEERRVSERTRVAFEIIIDAAWKLDDPVRRIATIQRLRKALAADLAGTAYDSRLGAEIKRLRRLLPKELSHRAAEDAPARSAEETASWFHDQYRTRGIEAQAQGYLKQAADLYRQALKQKDDDETRRLQAAARRELEAKQEERKLQAKRREEARQSAARREGSGQSARAEGLESALAELRKQYAELRASKIWEAREDELARDAFERITKTVAAIEDPLKKIEAIERLRRASIMELVGTMYMYRIDKDIARSRKDAKKVAAKVYKVVFVKIRKSPRDYKANIVALEEAMARVAGSRYEARIKERLDREKALLERSKE